MRLHVCLSVLLSILVLPTTTLAKDLLTFEGLIDLKREEINIFVEMGHKDAIVARAVRKGNQDYQIWLNLNHVKTPIFEISSNIESRMEFLPKFSKKDKVLHGKVWSQYSLIDYKPIHELSGVFRVEENRLYLDALSFGNLECQGYLDLFYPYKIDVSVGMSDISMDDFLSFWVRNEKYESEGDVSGEIRLLGDLQRLVMRGTLESFDGFVKSLKFDSIYLNIEGVYPKMQIARSVLAKAEGMSFTFGGPLNLSDHKNFKKQIKALSISPLVNNSESEVEWTIRRLKSDGKGTTELKYLKRKDLRLGDEENESDMIGIERTMEF